MRDFARKNSCLNKNIAIKNGIAKINVSKGELGLYFVVQNKACNGYKLMNPFLISAPNMVNGNYVYEVNAYPKMGLPEIKPEVSPEPSPEVSPEPSPEVSPEPSPEVSHEPSPEVSPEPSPEVSPNPDKPVQPENPENKLPQTGQLNWPIPFLVVLGIISFSIGWLLYFDRKREDHEA